MDLQGLTSDFQVDCSYHGTYMGICQFLLYSVLNDLKSLFTKDKRFLKIIFCASFAEKKITYPVNASFVLLLQLMLATFTSA